MHFRVGVIGATGFIATPYRREMREARDEATIVALCARRRDRLEAAAREDGAEFITDDWREVVEHPGVSFVVIATPDALHYEPAMACARHGKHVLCEKPVGMNTRQAWEIWTACRDAGLGHFVPYWSRYVPVFERARSVIEAGTLGEPRAFVWRWHNARPAAIPFTWRDNAGLSAAGSIADLGSHAYDAVRWMTGLQARRVLTHAGVVSGPKPDAGEPTLAEALEWAGTQRVPAVAGRRTGTAFDYAGILVEFEGGAVGVMTVSHAPFLRAGLAADLEIHGTEASLALDRTLGTLRLVRPGDSPPHTETVSGTGFGNRFARYVFPAVRERAAGLPSEHPGLEDGWRVQLFVDAAATSARCGGWTALEGIGSPGPDATCREERP
ncbi:MAG: Gfo/Idh/MocA family oxidoreductase [Gemmatimonadetes bacterium]|nr:Gfo/Idh/MocA family oxidoreductase [Gemmatimonadota bacterium]